MGLRELAGGFGVDLAEVVEVEFVGDEGEGQLFGAAVFFYFLKPLLEAEERLEGGEVVDEEDAVDAAIVLRWESAVLFLAGSVPD
jgi:hypothetical protein